MAFESIGELIALFLSTAGLTGGIISAVLCGMLKKFAAEADKKRLERLTLEKKRQEGDIKQSALLLTLLKYCKGGCELDELEQDEQAYRCYLEQLRAVENSILTEHTFK